MRVELDNQTMLITALIILLVLLFAYLMWGLGVDSACNADSIQCFIMGG